MIINSSEISNGSLIESDIIIIGGGVAGITLAKELSQLGHHIAILESGGEEPDYKNQSLYSGSASMGAPGISPKIIDGYLLSSRLRYYGGSGNHWDGLCAPLDPVDFIMRDWIPYSGWPFDIKHLAPFYNKACDLLEIPRLIQNFQLPHEPGEPSFLRDDIPGLISRPHFFTPYSGYEKNGNFNTLKFEVANHQNVRVFLQANVTNIVLKDSDDQVKELQISCLNGNKHMAKGKVFILATGGIENARILLASIDISKQQAMNQYDWIGRCFQGHASISDRDNASVFFTIPKDNEVSHNEGDNTFDDYRIWYILATSMQAQLRAESSNFSVYFADKEKDGVVEGLALRLSQSGEIIREGKHIQVHFSIEHTPNRESRINIMPDDCDELGIPRVKLEWQNSEIDFECFERSIKLLVKELGINNAGRVQWASKQNTRHKTAEYLSLDRSHHMGTTRMSIDPNYGVVNEQCQMHGIDNLYVAGSSVFPTSGIANPTLTIIALVYRMADHISNKLKRLS